MFESQVCQMFSLNDKGKNESTLRSSHIVILVIEVSVNRCRDRTAPITTITFARIHSLLRPIIMIIRLPLLEKCPRLTIYRGNGGFILKKPFRKSFDIAIPLIVILVDFQTAAHTGAPERLRVD